MRMPRCCGESMLVSAGGAFLCGGCLETKSIKEIENENDAACEDRDEQRAADGSQFYTPLPYHSARTER